MSEGDQCDIVQRLKGALPNGPTSMSAHPAEQSLNLSPARPLWTRKLQPFAPSLHYNECLQIFSLRFSYAKTVAKKKNPELVAVVLTQVPILKRSHWLLLRALFLRLIIGVLIDETLSEYYSPHSLSPLVPPGRFHRP